MIWRIKFLLQQKVKIPKAKPVVQVSAWSMKPTPSLDMRKVKRNAKFGVAPTLIQTTIQLHRKTIRHLIITSIRKMTRMKWERVEVSLQKPICALWRSTSLPGVGGKLPLNTRYGLRSLKRFVHGMFVASKK
jgi:hypothetical protein